MTSLARIGITMGDPAGIGPEVVLKAVGPDSLHTERRQQTYASALQMSGDYAGAENHLKAGAKRVSVRAPLVWRLYAGRRRPWRRTASRSCSSGRPV